MYPFVIILYIVIFLVIIVSLIPSTSYAQNGNCSCFNVSLLNNNTNNCYTYIISKNNHDHCRIDLDNIVLTTCPHDLSISISNLADKLQSITPTHHTSMVNIANRTGLKIDLQISNSNTSFTLCFNNITSTGFTSQSHTVYINEFHECTQPGLPCFS